VRFLLELGADPAAPDFDGKTPHILARISRNAQILLFIEAALKNRRP
jgi:ankyrin repeat protein